MESIVDLDANCSSRYECVWPLSLFLRPKTIFNLSFMFLFSPIFSSKELDDFIEIFFVTTITILSLLKSFQSTTILYLFVSFFIMFFHQAAKLSVGVIYFGNAEFSSEAFKNAVKAVTLRTAEYRRLNELFHSYGETLDYSESRKLDRAFNYAQDVHRDAVRIIDPLVRSAVNDLTDTVTSATPEQRSVNHQWWHLMQKSIDNFSLACSAPAHIFGLLYRGRDYNYCPYGNKYSDEIKKWLGDRKVQLLKSDGTSVRAIVDEVHLGKYSRERNYFLSWREPWLRVALLKPRVELRDDWGPGEQYIEIHFVNGRLQVEQIKLPYSENQTVELLLQETLADALDQKKVRRDCSQATFGGNTLDPHQTLIEAGVEAGGTLHVRLSDDYGRNLFNENKHLLKDEHGKPITQDVYLYNYDSTPFALDEHGRPVRSKLGANWMRWE